jgi:hypothetical protein
MRSAIFAAMPAFKQTAPDLLATWHVVTVARRVRKTRGRATRPAKLDDAGINGRRDASAGAFGASPVAQGTVQAMATSLAHSRPPYLARVTRCELPP